MEKRKWTLEGYDTFDDHSYPIKGEYDSEEAVELAAKDQLVYLEKLQPTASSGGQFGGIQDRVYVVRPDGSRYRYFG